MKYCLILPLLLLGFQAKAQLQFNSLEEVLKYANANAISLKKGNIAEQIANSEKKEAKSNLLPSINSSLGYNDNITLQPTLVPAQLINPAAEEGEFEELNFGTRYQYTRSLQAHWDILNFQKIFSVQTAEISREESKANTELSRYNTYNQLASTYYSILLTQESISIYEENTELTTSIYEHAQTKYEEGIISEADLNLAKINMLRSNSSLKLSQNNLDQFYLQLQSQLNTKESIVVTDSPENFVLVDPTISTIHPEVLLQEVGLKKYNALVKQTKAIRLPSVSLMYQYNQTYATNEFLNFSDANVLPQQLFGIQLSWSGLFSPSSKQKIHQSKLQVELQQLQLNNTKLIKQKEDELLQSQLQQSSDQLQDTKEILALQEQNDIHTDNKYQGGIISLDQRLDKYGDLLNAQDNYLQSLANYTLAQYKIYIRQIDFKSY
ncbi:MAG: TolC family protein [Bacteroidota bacterium]